MQYVDVALSARTGQREAVFTYAIPPSLLSEVDPGKLVDVPFRNTTSLGVIVRLRSSLPSKHLHGRLKPIKRIVSPWPVLSSFDLRLRSLLADQLAASEALVMTQLLPPVSLFKTLKAPIEPVLSAGKPSFWIGGLADALPLGKKAIQAALSKGTVLIVVPTKEAVEIWYQLLQESFPDIIHRYDPAARNKDQLAVWQAVFQGQRTIIIGTRSAAFLPFRHLALAFVDQPTHRQLQEEQAPYYGAFSVLELRARLGQMPLVARDALPAVRLFRRHERVRWQFRLLARSRAGIHLVSRQGGSSLSPTTVSYLSKAGEQEKRVLVVVGGAGWARGLVCQECGYLFRCPTCSYLLSVTDRSNQLRCATKTHMIAPTDRCPHCQSTKLRIYGWGSHKWFDYVKNLLPGQKVHEIRALDDVEAPWQIGVAAIQAVTTLPLKATVTVALEPERFLSRTDYRATEEWLRLLLVIRSTAPNLVIETHLPEHPYFAQLSKSIPTGAIAAELQLRQDHHYPPYGSLFRFETSATVSRGDVLLSKLAEKLKTTWQGAECIGPTPLDTQTEARWSLLVKLAGAVSNREISQLKKYAPAGIRVTVERSDN